MYQPLKKNKKKLKKVKIKKSGGCSKTVATYYIATTYNSTLNKKKCCRKLLRNKHLQQHTPLDKDRELTCTYLHYNTIPFNLPLNTAISPYITTTYNVYMWAKAEGRNTIYGMPLLTHIYL